MASSVIVRKRAPDQYPGSRLDSRRKIMPRKILKVIGYLLAVIAIALGASVGYSVWRWGRPFQAPLPPIAADRSREARERGAAIFHSTCEVCHRGPRTSESAVLK